MIRGVGVGGEGRKRRGIRGDWERWGVKRTRWRGGTGSRKSWKEVASMWPDIPAGRSQSTCGSLAAPTLACALHN